MTSGFYTIEERAKRYYGLTEVPQLAGYLLKDGSMLNFSHEGYQRDCDHRDIAQFFKNPQNEWSGTPFLYKFIRRGNIRCCCSGCCYAFEFSKIPTVEQLDIIRNAYKEANELGLDFIVEKSISLYQTKSYDYYGFMEYLQKYADYSL